MDHDLLCVVESGAGHHERAWAGRLRRAFQFLLGGGDPAPVSAARRTRRRG